VITITVASYNGAQLAQPLAAHFDEMGGNIGRADNNQLVLPDPERTISRVHAQVVFRSGRYAIVDRGSNPISVNGRPLGNGQEAMLQPGDEIAIGGYVMRVEAGGAQGGGADPFADFAGLAASASGAVPARAAPPAPQGQAMGGHGLPGGFGAPAGGGYGAPPAQASAGGFSDPLAGFGLAPSAPPAPSFGASPGFGGAPAAAAPSGGIPDDWDPFAPEPAAAPAPADFARSLGQPQGAGNFGLDIGGRAQPLIPDMQAPGGGSADSLDNLFGLGAGGGSSDPLAGSPLHQAAAQPNMAAHADPMKSLNSIGRGTGQAAPDTLRELNTPFTLPPMSVPAARPAAPPQPPAPAARAVPPAPPPMAPPAMPAAPPSGGGSAATPKGAVVSWDEPSGESRTVIRPRSAQPAGGAPAGPGAAPLDVALDFQGARGAAPPRPAQPFAAAPAQPPAAASAPAAARPAAPAATAAAMGGAEAQALIAALREGLAVDSVPPEALVLTPQLMRLLGQLLHEATRGTVDLLVARAALKREIRAEVTMIVSRENNPLKFSPSVEVALHHLLMPPARGFMSPDRAMRDAYDDLRAHQFGFLAGMRAALEGVLKRFDPAVLEGKLTKGSVISSILPGSRKARLWELFQELYAQISTEAADDFHELFGKEFLRAYEEYIDQLARDRG
jgi:FHA domain-containing protein